jgi:murein DD-endopeptidase MepM/ murein hydrolase activator NlpD
MKNTFLKLNTILILILVSAQIVSSQEYIWPTNASEYMSSSFCEFREGHYHAALDIKTWNTEGYPCYAIADGYIKRIRISPFGYGKVLYLQLNDGNTVLYAHLQKFTKDVEKLVRKQQFKNKKYQLNWWPKNLKVKKGDIIAYT